MKFQKVLQIFKTQVLAVLKLSTYNLKPMGKLNVPNRHIFSLDA